MLEFFFWGLGLGLGLLITRFVFQWWAESDARMGMLERKNERRWLRSRTKEVILSEIEFLNGISGEVGVEPITVDEKASKKVLEALRLELQEKILDRKAQIEADRPEQRPLVGLTIDEELWVRPEAFVLAPDRKERLGGISLFTRATGVRRRDDIHTICVKKTGEDQARPRISTGEWVPTLTVVAGTLPRVPLPRAPKVKFCLELEGFGDLPHWEDFAVKVGHRAEVAKAS